MLKRLLQLFTHKRDAANDVARYDLHPDASESLLHALDEVPPTLAAMPEPLLDDAHGNPAWNAHKPRYVDYAEPRSAHFMSRIFSWPLRAALRWLALLIMAALTLQIFFAARIALMSKVDPESTTFERSEIVRLWQESRPQEPVPDKIVNGRKIFFKRPPPPPVFRWKQQWADYGQISVYLKRAVIASEDDSFATHSGVDWVAMQEAWLRNQAAAQAQAQALAEAQMQSADPQTLRRAARAPKVVGASTISQQLAKNLFLSGERLMLRKAQELVLTLMLESLLDKQRILELYLNHVEWGEGLFGAQAAAVRYYNEPAARLNPGEAARLAVMLPRPRYFEKLPGSQYLAERASIIEARLWFAQLP